MALGTLKRFRRLSALPVAIFAILLLVALHLMSDAVQRSAELTRWFVPLLSIAVIGLVGMAIMLANNVFRLVVRYRHAAAGSRLTGRMVILFTVLSVVPVSVVYYYSMGFLIRGIDSWFDVEVDKAMEDALELSQSSLGLNQRHLLKYTERLLQDIDDQSEAALAISLDEFRAESGATELTLMNLSGRVIASSHEDPTVMVTDKPTREVMQQLKSGANYVGLTASNKTPLEIRALVRDPAGRPLILQGLYPTSERITALSEGLEGAYNRYKELSYLRTSLKFSFSLVLFLVLMFSLLSAMLAAFHTARRLVEPVARIAAGTQAVAEGNYDKKLPLPRQKDELSFLVASFNAMTWQLGRARDHELRAQQEVEGQRAYLETVLDRLSSGVLTFDSDMTLRTANPAAQQILHTNFKGLYQKPLSELSQSSPVLQQFIDSLASYLHDDSKEWREEVTLDGSEGRQVLMCRITPFIQPGDSKRGHVVVFDDITTLIKAQRDAAWGEVARRLAHEIKNPLTPIQLAAERLRHKYLSTMPETDAAVLDRSTRTIVQQVEAMKTMVNAFSEYARPPQMQPTALNADKLFSDVLDLYRSGSKTRIHNRLSAPNARVIADPVRLRQVVVNLIKNAIEAIGDQEDGRIEVHSREVTALDTEYYELRVEDNGPGFSMEVVDDPFEPYTTTKDKGNGLGLAIVKKIVEEHGGTIWAENNDPGACLILRLPIAESESVNENNSVVENS